MLNATIFGKLFTMEFRTGTGIDIEFCESRPVWGYSMDGGLEPLAFEGIIILLPCIVISYGTVCSVEVE